MENLDKVIKDLEFENESLVRQIREEIEAIDGIQKDIRNKTFENANLEEDVKKLNVDTKTLHDQFKQNKEITDSLKNATSLLQRHYQDLQSSLKLKIDVTEKTRVEHENLLQTYTNKWLGYAQEYEKRPLAKEIRKLKLEAASLNAEGKQLEERKHQLDLHVKEYTNDKNSVKQERQNAVSSIVKIAELRISGDEVVHKLISLKEAKEVLAVQIIEKEKELNQLRREEEEKLLTIRNQPEWVTAAKLKSSKNELLKPADLESNAQLKPACNNQAQALSRPVVPLPKLEVPQFLQRKSNRQLVLPKMPQLPKFSKFQAHRGTSDPETLNSTSTSPKTCEQPEEENELDTSSPKLQENVYTSSTESLVYTIPLEHSVNDFMRECGMEVDDADLIAPNTPHSSFAFSPTTHAEELKKLKQSPATGLMFRQSRPMYNALVANAEADSTSSSAISASGTNQLFGFSFHQSQNISTEEEDSDKDANAVKRSKVTAEQESSAKSKVSRQVSSPNAFNMEDISTEFTSSNPANTHAKNPRLSPGETSFNFGSAIDFNMKEMPSNFNFSSESPPTESSFSGVPVTSEASLFDLNFDNFQTSPSNGNGASKMGGFNFSSPSNATTLNNDGFTFSFGSGNTTTPVDDTSNTFSFSF